MRCCEGIAPQSAAPYFGFRAQAFDSAIEHLDAKGWIDHVVNNVAHRQQMDLRLLELNYRAACIGEIMQLRVQGVRDSKDTFLQRLVVSVLHRKRHQLGPMVPNLTGFLVMRCATLNMAAYCRSPRVTGPTILGITRDLR